MSKKIYEVFDGGVDGRDCSSIGYFDTRKLAEKYAKGRGTMGYGDGSINEISVYTEADERAKENKAKLRAQAKKKLTPEELDALMEEDD